MFVNLFKNNFSHNIVENIKNYRKFCSGFNSTYREELVVQTFCDVKIKVPFNVIAKPLDVHQYHNYDKLIIKLNNNAHIHTTQNGNVVEITSNDTHFTKETTCYVKAPVKANLRVETTLGDITIGAFHGDSVKLKSLQGNISAKRYEGQLFYSTTNNGNINLKGSIQAVNISAKINENGSITSDRLQGVHANLVTRNGNVSVKSSYCKESLFETDVGELLLENIHENCRILINKKGKLYLTGFNGTVNAILHNTEADVYISRFLNDSSIVLNDGNLILRLSEDSQHNNFEIKGKNVHLNDIKLLKYGGKQMKILVDGGNGIVDLRAASWYDMMKHKVNKQ